jgi:hypothetical protein
VTRFLLSAALMFALAAHAPAAPPPDVADLFPPTTLVYAELHAPGELGPQLAALFKGTPLEDSIPFIDGKKASAKTLQEANGKRDLATLALFVAPEMLAEFKKLGGVAIGLTGFNDAGEPEVAVAVLTGDSAAAGLVARAFITTSPSFRKVAEVSKVPVFQSRPPVINYDPNGQPMLVNDKPPAEAPYERTYAYTPGLFVAGTSRAAIAPVIKRFVGEEKAALRETAGFKSAASEFRKPGLFFYANAPELVARLDAAGRARGEPFESDLFAWLKLTANPKALRAVAGVVRFRDDGLALVASGTFDPAQKSPLNEFFTGPPVRVDPLHHVRRPAAFAATVNLPEKNRAAALVGFLDALAKSGGELGRLPSDVVKDIQTNHKVPLTDTLLPKVRAVTVIVPVKQELPKGAKPIPTFVLHLDDAAAAAAWEEALPKIVGEIGGEKPAQPSSETVNGVKVLSLPGAALPWKSAVHYARKETVLVIGLDRKIVSTTVTPDAAASVAGGPRPLIVPPGELALLGTVNLGELVAMVDLPTPTAPGRPNRFPRERRGEINIFGEVLNAPEEMIKEAEKARDAFLAAFGELPPASVIVRRTGNELRVEVFQPKVQGGGLTPVINAGVSWYDKLMNLRDPNGAAREIYEGPIKGRW